MIETACLDLLGRRRLDRDVEAGPLHAELAELALDPRPEPPGRFAPRLADRRCSRPELGQEFRRATFLRGDDLVVTLPTVELGGRSVSELEKKLIAEALEQFHGNKARVARELGLSYPTLLSRIRAYGLEPAR